MMDLSAAGDDVLSAILRHLPASDAVAVSQCDRRWCYLAEESFETRCLAKGWRLPRRPRGASATGSNTACVDFFNDVATPRLNALAEPPLACPGPLCSKLHARSLAHVFFNFGLV
jgi:hypothetical protein